MTAWTSVDEEEEEEEEENVTDGVVGSLDVRKDGRRFQPVISLEEVPMEHRQTVFMNYDISG